MTNQSPKTKLWRTGGGVGFEAQTILFNCDCHEFEAVCRQIVLAVGCSPAVASQLAYIAHEFGSATVFKGSREACEKAADILGSIGLVVRVSE